MTYTKTPDTKPTRIRYKKTGDNYKSTKSFLGNDGHMLHLLINPEHNTVTVVSDDIVIDDLTGKNFSDCKAKGKDMLKKYGVDFFDEIRVKEVKNDQAGV